ncbi:hypothetical protein K7640_20270 [Micromonospora sp. PLK6-60]|uniref:hypothetical protein n=1 Tax=Micromonospora sp. PLK6-60 TaxID=2873383 RepID=UPI001CA69265|nr:hypothetical protein [Micromonospora sp. PLK6-60]MBY8874167.1 hypothetical protein [Micromonospora sp. PLK6-60]
MSDASTALGVRLYPDLVEQDGLAAALADCAARHGLSIGRLSAPESGRAHYTHAEISCDRGLVRVGLAREARYFMVDISEGGRVRAHGDACDLLPVVQLAEAWCGGVELTELAARFPFLKRKKD